MRTTAHWAGRDMLVVLMENGHTPHEKTLRAAGHIQELLGGRQVLQVVVEEELKAAVSRALGRRVVTMLSATRLDPDVSAEIFLLEPEARTQETAGAAEELAHRAEEAKGHAEELHDEARALAGQYAQIRRRKSAPPAPGR